MWSAWGDFPCWSGRFALLNRKDSQREPGQATFSWAQQLFLGQICALLHQVVAGETWRERIGYIRAKQQGHTHTHTQVWLNTVILFLLITLSRWINHSEMGPAASLQQQCEAGGRYPPYHDILSNGCVFPEESTILMNKWGRLDCDWLSGTAAVPLQLMQVGCNDQ